MILENIKKHRKLLSFTAAIFMMYVLVQYIGLEDLAQALRMIDTNYLILALFLYGITLALNAYRWATIIGITGHIVSIKKALHFQLIDKAANAIFPTSAVGMALRSVLLHKEYKIPKSRGLASIVLDYGFEIFGTFMLAIPSFYLLRSSLPSYVNYQLYLFLGLLGVATLGIIIVNFPTVSNRVNGHLGSEKESMIGRLSSNSYGRKLLEFIGTFTILNKGATNTYSALGATFAIRIVEAIRMMVLFKAFGLTMPLYYFLLFESAWLFLSPFMITPGGIGAVESGRILLYSMIPQFTAASVAPAVFIDRFITFWLMTLIGIFAALIYNKGSYTSQGGTGIASAFSFKSFEKDIV